MRLNSLGIDPSVSELFPPEELLSELRDLAVEVVVLDESANGGERCDGVVTFVHRESFLDVKWVHSIQSGIDHFPQDRFRDAGVVLTNSTGIHGDAIGETVAGYLLAFSRRLHDLVANQQQRNWSQPAWNEAWTIAGERACVVGLGTLGRGVVDRITGLGLDVTGVRRTPIPTPGVDHVHTPSDLETAVSDARFVVLATPLTDQTRGMVDVSVLSAMREDAYLVNVSRGGVVDQPALVEAISSGEIAGAAMDVFETEPLPESSPLWEMDEVIVSPHCGAFTRDYPDRVATLVAENVRRFRAEKEPVNRVL